MSDWTNGFITGLIFAWLVGCNLPHKPGPGPTDDPSGCGSMCANLERLGCAAGEGSPGPDEKMGTPDDVSCKLTCESLLLSNPTVDLHLGCQTGAHTCAEADACFQ